VRQVLGPSVDVGSAPPPANPSERRCGGSSDRGVATPVQPPRPARACRRSACHRAPCRWRPGCSWPMLT